MLRLPAALEERADDLNNHKDDQVIHHVYLVRVDSGEHHEQGAQDGQHGHDLAAEAGQILALQQSDVDGDVDGVQGEEYVCVSFFTLFIAIWLHQTSSMGVEEAFRKSLFQVVSLQTSTGFVTADYMLWPSILWGCLIIVMIIGACAGSTTGGIKCIRMVILFQVVKNEFKHILHPNAILPVRVNKQVISPSIQSTVLAFTFLYVVIVIISVLVMMSLGVGFLESIGTVISSIGNMGPGLGTCGPAFSWSALPDAAKWLLSFLMLLGRLELFTVLLLFTFDFWKKN